MRLEVHVGLQIEVRIAGLRPDHIGGDSGDPAVGDEEGEARSGAWDDGVCLRRGAGDPSEFDTDFTRDAEKAEDSGDGVRSTRLRCSKENSETNLNNAHTHK